MNDKKIVVLLGEHCAEKWLLVDELIRNSRYILRDHSGSKVSSYVDYFKSEQLFSNNVGGKEVADIKKLKKLLPGCDAVICFGGIISRLKNFVDIAGSCGVRQFIHSVGVDSIKKGKVDDIDINSKTNVPEDGVDSSAEYVKSERNHPYLNVITVRPQSIDGKLIEDKISINVHLNAKNTNSEWAFSIRNPFRTIEVKSADFAMRPEDWKKYENLPNAIYYSDIQNLICMSILARLDRKPINVVWFLSNRLKIFLRRHSVLKAFIHGLLRPKWFYMAHGRMIIRLKDVFMMMVLIHLWPEQVYRFSTRKLLPKKGERNRRYSEEILPPLEVDVSRSKGIERMKEINIVMRGRSLDPKEIKNIPEPIFLSGIATPIQINIFGPLFIKYKKQVTYTSANSTGMRKLMKDGLTCMFLDIKEKDNKWNYGSLRKKEDKEYVRSRGAYITGVKTLYPILPSKDCIGTPIGMGLVTIAALFPFAEKINIYGWDFYLNSSPAEMGYWKLFFSAYNYKCDTRSRNHFESMLINFYYGYHLSRLPNVTIHGYLGQLQRHKRLISRIERVLFD